LRNNENKVDIDIKNYKLISEQIKKSVRNKNPNIQL